MTLAISYINKADEVGTSISATLEADGLGVQNLLTEPPTEVWRIPTVSSGSQTNLDIQFAANTPVDVIAMFAPRDSYLPTNYTVEVFGSAASMGASEALYIAPAALNLNANRGAWWAWLNTTPSIRYLRLRFTAGLNDQYLQFGRLWVGPDLVFNSPVSDGFMRGWVDPGSISRSAVTGIASAVRGRTTRNKKFAFSPMLEDEADALENISSAVGNTGQLIVNPRCERGAKDLVLGRLGAPLSPYAISPVQFSCELVILED